MPTFHGDEITPAPSTKVILAELRREFRPGVLRGALPARSTLHVTPAPSILPWAIGGVLALGVGYLVGRWWKKRKVESSGYEALAGNYLVGLDVLAAR